MYDLSGPFNRVFFQISVVAAWQKRFKWSLVGCGGVLHVKVPMELTGMDLKHKGYSEEAIIKEFKLKLLSS